MIKDLDTINTLNQKIKEFEEKMKYTHNIQERFSYQRKIDDLINHVTQLELKMKREMKELPSFTILDLQQFNGKENKKAYVAVNGFVYDVTENKSWKNFNHYGLKPGEDLTKAFQNCHGKEEILSKLPVVGLLKYE